MGVQYLYNRNGQLHFRMRVPKDLKGWFPTWVIQKSLNTGKASEAKLPMAGWVQKTAELFTVLRSPLLSQSIRKKTVENFLSNQLSRRVNFKGSDKRGEENIGEPGVCGKNKTWKEMVSSVLKAPVKGRTMVTESEMEEIAGKIVDSGLAGYQSMWNLMPEDFRNGLAAQVLADIPKDAVLAQLGCGAFGRIITQYIIKGCLTPTEKNWIKARFQSAKFEVPPDWSSLRIEGLLTDQIKRLQETATEEAKDHLGLYEFILPAEYLKFQIKLMAIELERLFNKFWLHYIELTWEILHVEKALSEAQATIKRRGKNWEIDTKELIGAVPSTSLTSELVTSISESVVINLDFIVSCLTDMVGNFIEKTDVRSLDKILFHESSFAKEIQNCIKKSDKETERVIDLIKSNERKRITLQYEVKAEYEEIFVNAINGIACLCKMHLETYGKPPQISVSTGNLEQLSSSVEVAPQTIKSRSKRYKGLLLSEAIDGFISESKSKQAWNEQTISEVPSKLNILIEILGDIEIRKVTRQQLVKVMDILQKLPSRRNTNVKFRGKKIAHLVKMGATNTLSNKSVNNYMTWINGLFIWAFNNQHTSYNPALNLKVKIDTLASEERAIYSKEDLINLFNSPVYNSGHEKYLKEFAGRPERFWIPLISLFSGARANEIAQLYVEDIVIVDEIPCISINNEKDKVLKNKASKRIFPIHPTLLELGFLEYIEVLRENQFDRLWMNLKKKTGKYGNSFTPWMQKINRIYITKDPKKSFHSFRHSFINNLKQSRADKSVIKGIVGHEDGSITYDRYGKSYEPNVMLTEILKLDYGLDIVQILREYGVPGWRHIDTINPEETVSKKVSKKFKAKSVKTKRKPIIAPQEPLPKESTKIWRSRPPRKKDPLSNKPPQ